MAKCNKILQASGGIYPRTCAKCGLGPCMEVSYAARTGFVWLLWAQHYDKSGEKFIRAYGSQEDAMAAKLLAESGLPSMAIYVTEVPLTPSPPATK